MKLRQDLAVLPNLYLLLICQTKLSPLNPLINKKLRRKNATEVISNHGSTPILTQNSLTQNIRTKLLANMRLPCELLGAFTYFSKQ